MVSDVAELLAGLDDEQRIAVTEENGLLCIVAGAGSGKTRVLTRRIAWRSLTGAEDETKVLALTFTRSSARVLASRLRHLGLRDGVRAGTFHSIAWRELQQRILDTGRPVPTLLAEPVHLLEEASGTSGAGLWELAAEISWARARCIRLEDYPTEATRAARPKPERASRVVDAALAFATLKRRKGVVDFDDILERLTDEIAADRDFAASQRYRMAHFYVDEFQDLNPLQHRLLEIWRDGRTDLTAVGDPNQAIYGWNGSDPRFMERFEERYPGAVTRMIDRNHRSSALILDVANSVLDAGDLPGVRLRTIRDDGQLPTVQGFATDHDEARAVARAVRDAKIPGTAWAQQAVLARTKAQLVRLASALAEVHVPFRMQGRPSIADEPIAKDALKRASRSKASISESIATLRSSMLPEAEPDVPATEEQRTLEQLLALAEEYELENQRPTVQAFRAWLLEAASDDGDAVDVMTFHAAKGREWVTVHVCGVEDGLVPIAHARTAEAIIEERRLFYVALTRAERRLHITWAARRTFGTRDADRRPSPLLDEIKSTLQRMHRDAVPAPPPPLDTLLARTEERDPDEVAVAAALRAWREGRARAAGIAPVAVLRDPLLERLVRARPHDLIALEAVPGTRPLVLAGLADEVLAVLNTD